MEVENKLKSILYLTVNTVNNKIYIGIHITETPYEFDGYYGDGITGTSCYWFEHPKYPFQKACKKYGLKSFKRYTLQVFETYEEARKAEANVVTEEFIKRPDTYNVALGGGSGLVPSVEIPVHQYDLEGNYICSYRSKSDAARKNNVNVMCICNATLYKSSALNSYWSETKVIKLNVANHSCKNDIPVYLYDKDGKYITSYDSISDCARKLDVNISCVRRAIEYKTKCGGKFISYIKSALITIPTKKRVRHKSYFRYNLNGSYIDNPSIDETKKICGKEYSKLHRAIDEHYSCAGFLWRREKEDSVEPLKSERKKKIAQYDLKGNLIKIWNSYRECNKEFSSLRKVLSGLRSETKGFTFKYIDN